jgi:uncharacterized membrane protein
MKKNTRIVGAVLAAIPILILSTSALCSWAIAGGASMKWRLAFRLLCHGFEERCIEMFGVAMPICSRCTGIYLGMLLGILTYAAAGFALKSAPAFNKVALLIAVLPLALDGGTQAMMLRESTNPLRIVSGLMAGTAFAMWVLSEMEHQETHAFTAP